MREERLGRYRIERLLGRGGMGEVYLATALGAAGFEKQVVVKVLRPERAGDPERTSRLLREAFIGVRLDHEHVVQVLDFDEADGKYFIVMEYVRGFTLAHLISHAVAVGEALPLPAVLHTVRAIADALAFLHEVRGPDGSPLGLVHRDVTPSNILLAADGRVKLSDFGLVALLDEERGGVVAGKLPYLPPEAFRGARPTQRWDVYALGAVLHEALVGRRPYRGDSLPELLISHTRPPDRLDAVRGDCPPALADVVGRAVDLDPEARFEDVRAFRGALDAAVPSRLADPQAHREHVAATYVRESFVVRNGQLPGSSSASGPVVMARPPESLGSEPTEVHRAVAPGSALRFGMSPALGAAMARVCGQRLAALLRTSLGRPVRTVVVADYRSLADCLVAGEVDVAWMPPAAFVEAEAEGARALVVAVRGGATSYESAVVVRADSPVQSLEGLRGQSMAWVDEESASGYLFAAAEVQRLLGPPAEVFRQQHFHGSHQAVCEAVLNGWAAAGATYVIRDADGKVTSAGWLDTLGSRADQVRPIAFSQAIPGDNIACRPNLEPRLVWLIVDTLVRLSNEPVGQQLLREVFNAEGFAPARRDAYAPVRAVVQLVGSGPIKP